MALAPYISKGLVLLSDPIQLADMTQKEQVRRLNKMLRDHTVKINEAIKVETLSGPVNLKATFSSSYASITWDDVSNSLRKDLDGARIWRADAAESSDTQFANNPARKVLVDCIRTTKYVDVEVVGSSTYIYWVQFVNKDGDVTDAAGGVSGTIA